MSQKSQTKLVREGEYVAEVGVALVEDGTAWGPYLTVNDATKLDDVRDALRAGDLQRASRLADHIYRLTPLSLTDAR